MSRKGAKGWSPGGGLSEAAAPGGGPKYTHASKERRGRQKERRTKKERVRHVEKGTKGFEHASGQRPGEFIVARLNDTEFASNTHYSK